MTDYIKREDAIKIINSGISIDTDADKRYVNGLFRAIRPADVAPVRYGLWYADEDSRIVCSECKHGAPYMYKISDKLVMQELTDYCPNCGARMDGESDE